MAQKTFANQQKSATRTSDSSPALVRRGKMFLVFQDLRAPNLCRADHNAQLSPGGGRDD